MERVVLDGIAYVRVADAAAQFKYTSDYVGQLCRSKKVDARLVGRAWYVNIDSIKEYRQAKHDKRKTRSNEKKIKKELKNKVSVKVSAPERPVKITIHESTAANNRSTVHYETDTTDLLPRVNRSTSVKPNVASTADFESTASFAELGEISGTSVPVTAEKKAKIKVESQPTHSVTDLVATELPTVSLSGSLSVADASNVQSQPLEDEDAQTVSTPVDEVKKHGKITLFLLTILKIVTWPIRLIWKLLYPVRKIISFITRPLQKFFLRLTRFLVKKWRQRNTKKVSFTPKTAQLHAAASPKESVNYQQRIQFWSLLVSALLTALLVLSLGAELSTLGDTSQFTFFVNRSWIFDLISRL